MKAILLQVGFDSENGGYSAPLFEDGSFVYLPIPERRSVEGNVTYADYERMIGSEITPYLPTDRISVGPEKMAGRMSKESIPVGDVMPHIDPDFLTYTYGEQSNIARGQTLLRLFPGDYIFFFQSFVEATRSDTRRRTLREIRAYQSGRDKVYGIIGYFELERLYHYMDIMGDSAVRERVKMNAHLKRKPLERTIIIATGTKKSKMLNRTKVISTIGQKKTGAKNYIYSREFSEISKLDGQVPRIVRTIEGSGAVADVLRWLDKPFALE